jgi:hypothetical protein
MTFLCRKLAIPLISRHYVRTIVIHENINKYTYLSEFLIFKFSFMIIIFLHISEASCNSLIHKYTSSWSTPHSHQHKLLSFVFGENIQNIGIWRYT